ncbi:hypothetical protein GQ44DRAFT_734374 [Phaeosphaeriaceae sp. PMI808]|nr:hypothetical protein GQ44DRAFT_734374 [Phaeosphaeriaceae sp. PMI808]
MGGTHFTLDQAIRIVEGDLENHASPGFVMGRDGKMKIEKPNPGIGGELAKHKDLLAYAKKIVKVWKEEGPEAAEAWAKSVIELTVTIGFRNIRPKSIMRNIILESKRVDSSILEEVFRWSTSAKVQGDIHAPLFFIYSSVSHVKDPDAPAEVVEANGVTRGLFNAPTSTSSSAYHLRPLIKGHRIGPDGLIKGNGDPNQRTLAAMRQVEDNLSDEYEV